MCIYVFFFKWGLCVGVRLRVPTLFIPLREAKQVHSRSLGNLKPLKPLKPLTLKPYTLSQKPHIPCSMVLGIVTNGSPLVSLDTYTTITPQNPLQ